MMSTSTFITTMDAAIEAYLAHQRAMGRGYATEERVLYSLRDFLAQAHAVDLDQSRFEGWRDLHLRLTANVRRSRQRLVRNFCLYRRRSEPDCFVPDLGSFPRPQPYRAPVLVEPDQIGRMLELATHLTPTPVSPLRPAVLRLAVVLQPWKLPVKNAPLVGPLVAVLLAIAAGTAATLAPIAVRASGKLIGSPVRSTTGTGA